MIALLKSSMLLMAVVGVVASAPPPSSFPFLFDVATKVADPGAEFPDAGGRVKFNSIFECPHP
jgi:hypothetical protein